MDDKARADHWYRMYRDCFVESAAYSDKMTGKLLELEAEIKEWRRSTDGWCNAAHDTLMENMEIEREAREQREKLEAENARLREENARMRRTLQWIAAGASADPLPADRFIEAAHRALKEASDG